MLDKLLAIRTKLELLKQDKSTYVKSQDVIELYDQVVEQVEVLNQIRTTKRLEQNRGISPCGVTPRRMPLTHAFSQQWTRCWTTVFSSSHSPT